MDINPKVFIISGPSGAGKGTLTVELLRRVPSLTRSISVTTRKPRPGEIEGFDYYFVTEKEFKDYIENDDFLEWALVHGNYYGTLRSTVERELGSEHSVVLVIDVQGAATIRKKMPKAVLIFIEPPSIEELIKRLKGRNTENEAELARRIKNAEAEMELAKEYDYVVINDDVKKATEKLIEIVRTEMQAGINNKIANRSEGDG